MKVLTFTRLFPNQVLPELGIFVRRRLFAFAAAGGHALAVVAPVPYFPRLPLRKKWYVWSKVPAEEIEDGFRILHPRYFNPPWLAMRYYGELLFAGSKRTVCDLHREFGFDILDGHYMYPDGYAAVKLASRLGLPVVLSARGTDVNAFTRMRAIRPLVLQAAARADAVIAVSQGLADKLCQLGIPAKKVRVIRNGVDSAVFRPRDRAAAREKLQVPADCTMLLTVSSLLEAKGHRVLLEAFSRSRSAAGRGRGERVELFVVGEGPLRKEMARTVRRAGLESKVHLCGQQAEDRMPWWYSAADVAVHPSLSEGCPNVVLEALSCGVPVVASAVGEIPGLVHQDRTGLLVPPGDPGALAAALDGALKRSWDRDMVRESVRTLTWGAAGKKLEEVYRTVLRGTG